MVEMQAPMGSKLPMASLWSFLSTSKNQKTLSWIGGGLVVVIAGLWAAFVYFNSPKSDAAGGQL
jgi:hypothetical protein